MVVAGEEWKDGCESAGVVAVIGEILFAMLVGIWCKLCWKKGPGFRVPGVLLPYCCCGERLEDQGSLFVQVYPALPACESGEDPPFIATGDVWRCMLAPSDTVRPGLKVSLPLSSAAILEGERQASDELLLEAPSGGNNEALVTGVGEDLSVLGISEAWYWFCGGRCGNGGIIRCLLLEGDCGRCPEP